jgi:hypothetical protein
MTRAVATNLITADWFTNHPEFAEWSVAAGTLALAFATLFLALQALSEAKQVRRQVEISAQEVDVSRAALAAQGRPILIDVPRVQEDHSPGPPIPYEHDFVRYPKHYEVEVDKTSRGNFVCSVPLRNAGPGLAFIKDNPRLAHPGRDVDLIGLVTTQIVPPGDPTRAYFAPGIAIETPDDASFIAKVPYSDTSGSETFWTEATIAMRNQRWRVVQVAIRRDGEKEPLVRSAAAV